MPVVSCPPDAELKQIFLNGLPAQQAQEEHILACRFCLAKLKTLVPTPDTLAGWLSADTRGEDFVSSPVVSDLLKQLRALHPASASPVPQRADMIGLTCTSCQNKLSVNEALAGKKVKCPSCGQVLVAPVPVSAGAGPAERTEPLESALSPNITADEHTLPSDPTQTQAGNWPTHSGANLLEATFDSQAASGGPDFSLTDFLSPAQSADELGRLGKYRILKVLGHGGMGVVYKAEDPLLKRIIALKAMLPTLAASASAGKRFLREAQAMAAVEHDHIVRVHEVAEDRGVPFLAMEFLKGEPLDVRLEREKLLPVLEVVRLGKEIAEGLAAAHERGLIHRDIKPANVWLEAPKGRVKILDFGLARSAQQEPGLTKQGAILGTPAYMAPEQARGETVDARCDLFSLGVILYRLSSGKSAFRGTDTISTLMSVAMEQPPPPHVANPELPAELSGLVMKLLEKDPQRRPASAAAVAEALQALEQKLRRAQEQHDQTELLDTPPKKETAPAKRNRLPVLAGSLVLLVGLIGIGLWAAEIFRVQTEKGDLVLESDDEDFAFSPVKGGGVTLEDRKAKKTYALKVVPLGQDKFQLEVLDKGADLVFQTVTFTVKRGEKVALKAWFERKQTVAVTPPVPTGHDTWIKAVAMLPAEKQVEAVAARLKERNPGFNGTVGHRIEHGVVTELTFKGENVTDLSPVRALVGLKVLICKYGPLSDLSPLKGMPLTMLNFAFCSQVQDLSPLKGMPLTSLSLAGCRVQDLALLKDLPLTHLNLENTQVRDVEPLKGLRLNSLSLLNCRVGNLEPLKDLPLTSLDLRKTPVQDLKPLKGMKLTELDLDGCTQVRDLEPLKGMPLTSLRLAHCTQVQDLSPLKGMKLTRLSLPGCTEVRDLELLKGMPLKWLFIQGTGVTDLKPLQGMELDEIGLTPKSITQGLDILRAMKSLKMIGISTPQTWPAAEFWARYDKGEFTK